MRSCGRHPFCASQQKPRQLLDLQLQYAAQSWQQGAHVPTMCLWLFHTITVHVVFHHQVAACHLVRGSQFWDKWFGAGGFHHVKTELSLRPACACWR